MHVSDSNDSSSDASNPSSEASNPSSLLRNPFCPKPIPAFIQAQAEDWKELMAPKPKTIQQTLPNLVGAGGKPPTGRGGPSIRSASASPAPGEVDAPPPAPAAAAPGRQSSEAPGGQSSEAAKDSAVQSSSRAEVTPEVAAMLASAAADGDEFYKLWGRQIPDKLLKTTFSMPKALYLWEVFALETWCKLQEQHEFCELICEKAFKCSSVDRVLWGEVDFLTTLLTSLGILTIQADGLSTVITQVEDLDIAQVAWAFAFYKKLKNQSFELFVKRLMEDIMKHHEPGLKKLLDSGFRYLYTKWW